MTPSNQRAHHSPDESLEARLGWLLLFILLLAVVAIGIAAAVYRSTFPYLSSDQDLWGKFGDFFGGALNPILSFLGLIALLLSLWVQSRELAASTAELAATREQLSRSAAAHERAEAALREQARASELVAELTAVNNLLESYTARIRSRPSNDPGTELFRKREQLWARTEELHNALVARKSSPQE